MQRTREGEEGKAFACDVNVAKDKLAVWTRPEDSREKWSKPEANLVIALHIQEDKYCRCCRSHKEEICVYIHYIYKYMCIIIAGISPKPSNQTQLIHCFCKELERPSLELDILNTERTQKASNVRPMLHSFI